MFRLWSSRSWTHPELYWWLGGLHHLGEGELRLMLRLWLSVEDYFSNYTVHYIYVKKGFLSWLLLASYPGNTPGLDTRLGSCMNKGKVISTPTFNAERDFTDISTRCLSHVEWLHDWRIWSKHRQMFFQS